MNSPKTNSDLLKRPDGEGAAEDEELRWGNQGASAA
jgi:hypothetical protein